MSVFLWQWVVELRVGGSALGRAGLLALALLLGGADAAAAQPVRTLVIQNDTVVLDGTPLEPKALPPSLDVAGKDLYVQFSGEAWPVVEIDDVAYRLGQGRLIELRSAEAPRRAEVPPAMIASLSVADGRTKVASVPARSTGQARAAASAPPEAQLQADLNALRSGLYTLRQRANQTSMELGRTVDALVVLAERAGETLAALPAWEVERYLQEVQAADAALVDRLQAEQALEREARHLARRALQQDDARQRARYTAELRATLTTLFALKQDNQRRELAQMQAELEALHDELATRDQRADELIDRRLKQLLDEAGRQ